MKALFRLLAQRWALIGSFGLVAALVVGGISLIMTPVYRADVLLAPVDDSDMQGLLSSLGGPITGLAGMAGLNVGGATAVTQEAIATMQSRGFLMQFIQEKSLLPKLFRDEWSSATNEWRSSDPADRPTLTRAYEEFLGEILQVTENKQSGLVQLTIDWRDPEEAALWANHLVDRLNSTMRARALSEAQRSMEYLNQELKKNSTMEVQQTIYRLIETELKKSTLANTRDEYVFRVIDRAVAPAQDEYRSPNRAAMIIAGLIFGLFIGFIVAVEQQPEPANS